MLTELLELLDEGRAYSQREMAEKLGIGAAMIIAEIEYLELLGLLRRVDDSCGCSGGCKGCSSACNNEGITPPAMWEKAV